MKKLLLSVLCVAAQITLVYASDRMSAPQSTTAATATRNSWSLFQGPDGKYWTASIETHLVNKGNEYYDDWGYLSLDVTVSDASHQSRGSFTVELDGTPNSVEVFGPITAHLFNSDDQYELAVDVHTPGNADNGYVGSYRTLAYSLDGQKVFDQPGVAEVAVAGSDAVLILTREEGTYPASRSISEVYHNVGNGLELLQTVSLDATTTNYMCSQTLTTVAFHDGLHFIVAHYENPMVEIGEDGMEAIDPVTWMPVWTPDNHFIVEHYDSHFQLIDKFSLPAACPDDVMSRMMGIGAFSDSDITEGYFTRDDRYNYVVLCEDMDASWNDHYVVDVYAQGGDHVGTLCGDAGSYWARLSDIEGQPQQWLFLQSGEGTQQLSIVETPSFATFCTLPASVDGKLISTNLDRKADADEGYKYVIGLNEPDLDADANLIALYGIYHNDFTIDRYVGFNLGSRAEAFLPLVNQATLDPHLFDADDEPEYIFISKTQGAYGELYNHLFVCKEDGSQLLAINGEDDPRGNIYTATILNYGTDQPELFVAFYDDVTDTNTFETYSLPLVADGLHQLSTVSTEGRAYNLMGLPVSSQARGLKLIDGRKVMTR